MADAAASNTAEGNLVGVRVPPSGPGFLPGDEPRGCVPTSRIDVQPRGPVERANPLTAETYLARRCPCVAVHPSGPTGTAPGIGSDAGADGDTLRSWCIRTGRSCTASR